MTRIEKENHCILLIDILQYCYELADDDQTKTCNGHEDGAKPQKLKYNNEDIEVCCHDRQVAKESCYPILEN